jgi:hypothetical protein
MCSEHRVHSGRDCRLCHVTAFLLHQRHLAGAVGGHMLRSHASTPCLTACTAARRQPCQRTLLALPKAGQTAQPRTGLCPVCFLGPHTIFAAPAQHNNCLCPQPICRSQSAHNVAMLTQWRRPDPVPVAVMRPCGSGVSRLPSQHAPPRHTLLLSLCSKPQRSGAQPC